MRELVPVESFCLANSKPSHCWYQLGPRAKRLFSVDNTRCLFSQCRKLRTIVSVTHDCTHIGMQSLLADRFMM